MKTLVAYYSLTNNTKEVAEMIAKFMNADLESIKDTKPRDHLKRWEVGAFDEKLRTPTKIHPTKYNSQDYDLVIIGTPIWDGITPAVKAYLKNNKFKKTAFFITFGAAADDAAYVMGKLSKTSKHILELQDRQIKLGKHRKYIKDFTKKLR
jgi:flavodoxin